MWDLAAACFVFCCFYVEQFCVALSHACIKQGKQILLKGFNRFPLKSGRIHTSKRWEFEQPFFYKKKRLQQL